jgi:ornithine carbamoyltransferase
MAARESDEPLEGRLCTKSKIARQEEVADKADKISSNIGNIGYRAEQQHIINAIMDS